MKFGKWTFLRVLALMLVVACIWCLNWDRTSLQNWAVPIDYFEDTPMELGWFKAAAEGDFVPFLSKTVSRLGAPYVGNWNDWPGTWGEFSTTLMGLLTRWFGLFPATNIGVLLAYLGNALGFYFCCRLLRFRWEWSFVAAVLFAFAYFHNFKGLHHYIALFSISIPFILLSVWWVGFSKRLRWGGWPLWLCLITAITTGMSNPYSLNMFLQLLCLAWAVQFLTRRRKANLQIGALMFVLAVGFFLIMNLDTFTYEWAHGKNEQAVPRGFYETELFALKPIELMVPPVAHKIAALGSIGSKYLNWAYLKGEVFSPYLGIVVLAGLVWMGAEAFLLAAKRQRGPRRFPSYSGQALWIIGYSVVGGLNCIIALLTGLLLFRGTNRFSIFISALVLLFLASRLTRWTRTWSPGQRFALGGALLLIGLIDQIPQATSAAETQAIAQVVEADRDFTKTMEEQLPPRAMVYELPVMRYPEAAPIQHLGNYELLRPYLHSHSLRFSFGTDYGRPQDDWQKEVEKLPPQEMVKALEKYGFSAIYLNRKGFADQAEGLLKQLAACGKQRVIEDALHEQVCIFLNPSPKPELPPAGNRALIVHHGGWIGGSEGQAWVNSKASLSVFNPDKDVSSYSLTCQLGSLTPHRVHLLVQGKEVWSGELPGNQLLPVRFTFDALPRYNQVEFKTDEVESPSKFNPIPRAFAVVNLQIVRTASAAR